MSSPSAVELKQILTNEEWKSLYSRDDYVKKTDRAQNFTLHYLLGMNQSDDAIIKYIKEREVKILSTSEAPIAKAEKSQALMKLISVDESAHKLTPLIICAMRARRVVLEVLIGCIPEKIRHNHKDIQDINGWTALHHAAITSDKIFTLLSTTIGLKKKTLTGATPTQIMALTTLDDKSVAYTLPKVTFVDRSGTATNLSKFTPEDFKKLTSQDSFTYRDASYFPPKFYKQLWINTMALGERNSTHYIESMRNTPKLMITPCKQLLEKDIHCYELRANEPIESFTFIGEYSGQVRTHFYSSIVKVANVQSESEDEYLLEDIDARKVGNAIRFSNHGWPNAYVSRDYSMIEGAQRSVLISFEKIPLGDPILWDYGFMQISLSLGKHVVLGREKMLEFYKTSLTTRFNETKKLIELAQISVLSKIIFPFNTPAALIDLHFTGLVKCSEWKENLHQELIQKWAALVPFHKIVFMIMDELIEFDKVVLDQKAIYQASADWIFSNMGKLTIIQIIKGLQMIRLDVIKKIKIEENVSQYFNALEIYLKDYDPERDLSAPISESAHIKYQLNDYMKRK